MLQIVRQFILKIGKVRFDDRSDEVAFLLDGVFEELALLGVGELEEAV
jgi:hypothetical protein